MAVVEEDQPPLVFVGPIWRLANGCRKKVIVPDQVRTSFGLHEVQKMGCQRKSLWCVHDRIEMPSDTSIQTGSRIEDTKATVLIRIVRPHAHGQAKRREGTRLHRLLDPRCS